MCFPVCAPSEPVAITVASIAPATRRVYAGQVVRFDAWLKREGRTAEDAAIAGYLAEMHAGAHLPRTQGRPSRVSGGI